MALDFGTSSVRAGLYRHMEDPVPVETVKNDRLLTSTQDGGFEIDADEAFDQAVQAIDDLLKKASVTAISHCAISCFWHSLMGIDERGNPTTKLFAWAETRPAKYVDELKLAFDESTYHNRTGCRFHSMYWSAKLLWLRKDFPAQFKATAKWISFSDYFALKTLATNNLPVTSVSIASGTGIFDLRKNLWDKELLDFLEIDEEKLPQIANDGETYRLNKKFAKQWKKLVDAKWFNAIGDGAANNIGAGCFVKNKLAIMIGTSGAMRTAFIGEPPAQIPAGLFCYRIDRKSIVIGGALSDGGGLYHWLKDNFRLNNDDDETEKEIAKRSPFGHGITFLPFFAGERSTGFHDFARGAIIGLRTAHDNIDVVQAALEAVAFRFADIFDQLSEVVDIEQIIASGGALRESPVWTQIISDVIGRELDLPDTREASSRGVILLAAKYLNRLKDISAIETPPGKAFYPNQAANEKYLTARKIHEGYYRMLLNPQK